MSLSVLCDTGLMRPLLLPYLRARDVLSLASACKSLFSHCTYNALSLRGRTRVLAIDNVRLRGKGSLAAPAGEVVWSGVSSAEFVVGGELMLALTESLRTLLISPQ